MKKIIAKEFLILLSTIVISILSLVYTYGYNIIINNQKSVLEDSLKKTSALFYENINALKSNYNKKIDVQNDVFYLGSRFYNNVGYGKKYETRYQFWNVVLKDDYKTFMDDYNSNNSFWKQLNTWGHGYINSYESLREFLEKYTINEKDQNDYDTAVANEKYRKNLENRIRTLKSKLINNSKKFSIATNTFLIAFLIAFLLRYLIIAIMWSIRTLKS